MVNHEIIGDDMQAVILTLAGGDAVPAEAGAMMFMTDAIEMDAKMEGGSLAQGKVFMHSGGTILPLDPAAGERLEVDTGCMVALDATVDYDIVRVGGIKTSLFGGEGLFFCRAHGAGTRLAADPAVLAARRQDQRRAPRRPRRRETRFRRDARRVGGPDRGHRT